MAEEDNTDIDMPLAVEVSEDEGSEDKSFDIPVVAVTEISEPEDIIEESIDIIDIPATTEVNEPESSNVEVIVDISTPKFGRKIPSRYLHPHTSSCHDFCKYGVKNALEGKPASPVLRKDKSVGGNGQDLRRIIVSLAKQNKDAISSKSSPDYKATNNTDMKEDVISAPEIVTPSPKRLLPSVKEVHAAAVHYSRTKLNLSLSKVPSIKRQGSFRIKRNKEVQKGKKQNGDGSSSSRSNRTSRCQHISAEEDIKALVPQVVSWTPRSPRHRVVRVAIADKKIIGRRGLKNQRHPKKCKPDPSINEVVEEKTIYMIEPSTKNETEESAQNSVDTTELSRPQSSSATDNSLKHEQEADGNPVVPPLSVKNNVRRARNGTSSKILSTSSPVSGGVKGLRPKRLGMTPRSETRSAPSSPPSSRGPSEPVHGKRGGTTSGKDVKKGEKSKVEHRIKIRRQALTDTEDGDCQPRKLKFRKGKTVELQTETITPRRLKFRHVRLLGETHSLKTDSRKRNIKSKEANQNGDEVKEAENSSLRQQDQEIKKKKSFRRKETIDYKLVSSRIKSERVVLKHQDSKGKKEIQNLFNNVIEETASKLAQTRKSKVKALVGAFETVISLQDTRPAATVVA